MIRAVIGSFALGWITSNAIRIFSTENFTAESLFVYIIVGIIYYAVFGYLVYRGIKATRKAQKVVKELSEYDKE